MSTPTSGTSTPNPRFTSQSASTATVADLLSNQTVGLVNLSDYRKRRAEAIEQKERDAQELHLGSKPASGAVTPAADSGASTSSQVAPKKKKRKVGKPILSFGDEEEEDSSASTTKASHFTTEKGATALSGHTAESAPRKSKLAPNASVGPIPKALNKRTLLQESQEREALRKEFLALQERVKASPFAIPFVFYDGSNLPGGTCRVTKGDYVWKFLDSSRKVGAEVGANVDGEKGKGDARARREWAKVSVDDLMMVRGEIIIPPHYDFYYFVMNKTKGPKDKLLFDYSTQPPNEEVEEGKRDDGEVPDDYNPLSRPTAKAQPTKAIPMEELEGASDDPTFTKVVDRRWYERNKHIYPASVWQNFDSEKDYQKEIKRDAGGNAFFFS